MAATLREPNEAEVAVERVTAVLMAMETAPANTFRLTPLGIRTLAGVEGVVMIRIGEVKGALAIHEARLLIGCLRADDAFRGAGVVADLVENAARQAERLRDGAMVAASGGRLVETVQ